MLIILADVLFTAFLVLAEVYDPSNMLWLGIGRTNP